MLRADALIAAMDSGVGGLTVVRSLRSLLPGEDVLFFGDSANCPYGNRSEDEIFALGMDMIRGLEKEGVKCIVIACNTISSLLERFERETDIKLFSIIDSTADYVAGLGLRHAGLIATERTVDSGLFSRRLCASDPAFRLTAQSSRELAAMIEGGAVGNEALDEEIRRCVDEIIRCGETENLILGCTHYPIAEARFKSCYPRLNLIDASQAQAQAVARWLDAEGILREGHSGALRIRTSGGAEAYERVCRQLGIAERSTVETVNKL